MGGLGEVDSKSDYACQNWAPAWGTPWEGSQHDGPIGGPSKIRCVPRLRGEIVRRELQRGGPGTGLWGGWVSAGVQEFRCPRPQAHASAGPAADLWGTG